MRGTFDQWAVLENGKQTGTAKTLDITYDRYSQLMDHAKAIIAKTPST